MREPGIDIPVVLVISGDSERAIAGAQVRQRSDMGRELPNMAVHDVSGEHDQIRRERVDLGDDLLGEVRAEGPADVDVGELDDRVAVGGRGQLRDRHADAAHERSAARMDEAVADRERGGGEAGERRIARCDPGDRAGEVREHGGEQEIDRAAKPRVRDPQHRLRAGAREPARDQHRRGQARREHDHRDRREHGPRAGPSGRLDEAPPDVGVRGAEHREHDGDVSTAGARPSSSTASGCYSLHVRAFVLMAALAACKPGGVSDAQEVCATASTMFDKCEDFGSAAPLERELMVDRSRGLCRAVFTGETKQLMPNALELYQALDEGSRAGLKIQAQCTSKATTCLAYHACNQ